MAAVVPKDPIEVVLVYEGGRREAVTIFLDLTTRAHEGPETIEDFLNAPRRFLPVRHGADAALVSRVAIAMVRVPPEVQGVARREVEGVSAVDMVRVLVLGGGEVSGVLAHVNVDGRARPSDHLNGPDDFFAIEDDVGVVFVNKRHVAAVLF